MARWQTSRRKTTVAVQDRDSDTCEGIGGRKGGMLLSLPHLVQWLLKEVQVQWRTNSRFDDNVMKLL